MEEDKIKEEGQYNPEKSENNKPVTPPPTAGRYGIEEEWAEKLGMDFDPDRIAPPPIPDGQPEGEIHPEAVQQPQQASGSYVFDATRQQAPFPGQMPEREPMPPTYMLWAVLATICCCMPAGIVAIIFSSSVSSKYFSRDYEGARRASRNAEIWIIVSIVAGIIANALYLPLMLLAPQ